MMNPLNLHDRLYVRARISGRGMWKANLCAGLMIMSPAILSIVALLVFIKKAPAL